MALIIASPLQVDDSWCKGIATAVLKGWDYSALYCHTKCDRIGATAKSNDSYGCQGY